MWICLHTLGFEAITSKRGSGKSLGCGDVNLNLISGAASDTMSIKSANRGPAPPLSLNISLKPAEFRWTLSAPYVSDLS